MHLKTTYLQYYQFINYEFVPRARIIKDMHEEIRREKYSAEKQMLLEEKETTMREVQLEKTCRTLQDHESAFIKYVADSEKEENVNIALPFFYIYIYIYQTNNV